VAALPLLADCAALAAALDHFPCRSAGTPRGAVARPLPGSDGSAILPPPERRKRGHACTRRRRVVHEQFATLWTQRPLDGLLLTLTSPAMATCAVMAVGAVQQGEQPHFYCLLEDDAR
jgi:hypothetical protein